MARLHRLKASISRVAATAFAGFMLFLIVACLAEAIRVSDNGANAAAWVQAAGSISAICGAIWISGSESRRARRQRRRDGEQAAWSTRFAIKLARNEAATIATELASVGGTSGLGDAIYWRRRCRNALQLLRYCTNSPGHFHPAFVQAGNNAIILMEEMEEGR